MSNPWEEISLSDYENHMSLESVNQLQTMNSIMKKQFSDYPVKTAMVLGIAGGNGLEHVSSDKFEKVYGIDINEGYLKTVEERYKGLAGILECLSIDLITEPEKLPHAELVIANLLIEYIGYEAFQKAVQKIDPEYVSCVIQINTDEAQWVSDSPYLHAFDRLDDFLRIYGNSFIGFNQIELTNYGRKGTFDKLLSYFFFSYRRLRGLR